MNIFSFSDCPDPKSKQGAACRKLEETFDCTVPQVRNFDFTGINRDEAFETDFDFGFEHLGLQTIKTKIFGLQTYNCIFHSVYDYYRKIKPCKME